MTILNINGWMIDTRNPYHDRRTFTERKAERIAVTAVYHRNAFNQAMAECERNRVLSRRRVREGNMSAAKFYQGVSASWYREAVKHQ